MVSGLLVALVLSYLPGTGGHKPAEGFKAGGATLPSELPAVILASFATLALGVVLGPEAPLIAIGSGIGVIAIRLLRKDAPKQADRRRRRGGQLRRDQHPARVAADRRVPADGGGGPGRRHAERGAGARAAGGRHRRR